MDIIATLKELGDTEQDVFQNLKKAGAKGQKDSNDSCPIAMYLKTKGFEDPSVGNRTVRNGFNDSLDMPQACQDWIEAFDNGKYPELVFGHCCRTIE